VICAHKHRSARRIGLEKKKKRAPPLAPRYVSFFIPHGLVSGTILQPLSDNMKLDLDIGRDVRVKCGRNLTQIYKRGPKEQLTVLFFSFLSFVFSFSPPRPRRRLRRRRRRPPPGSTTPPRTPAPSSGGPDGGAGRREAGAGRGRRGRGRAVAREARRPDVRSVKRKQMVLNKLLSFFCKIKNRRRRIRRCGLRKSPSPRQLRPR